MFQSYLRWIRYSRSFHLYYWKRWSQVSILFEVDSVFEVWKHYPKTKGFFSFNPIWGGFGIRGSFTRSTLSKPRLVSILFEVDSVFEEIQCMNRWWTYKCFNPIWGGFGIRGAISASAFCLLETGFNPIWGGFGIRGKGVAYMLEAKTEFQSYLRWIRYSRTLYSPFILQAGYSFNPIWGGFGIRGYVSNHFNPERREVSILFEVDSVFEEYHSAT